jgi:hypothetical protein
VLPFASFELPKTTTIGDAREPGWKACLAAETRQPLPHGHERFLGTRTGILLIHAQIEDAALVSSHEERKGILVSLLIDFHQLCFALLASNPRSKNRYPLAPRAVQ